MIARSHADRGQLFGWDGANMRVEQTLGSVPDEVRTICPGSGKVQNSGGRCAVCEQPSGGWETRDGMVRKWHSLPVSATCPENHLSD